MLVLVSSVHVLALEHGASFHRLVGAAKSFVSVEYYGYFEPDVLPGDGFLATFQTVAAAGVSASTVTFLGLRRRISTELPSLDVLDVRCLLLLFCSFACATV